MVKSLVTPPDFPSLPDAAGSCALGFSKAVLKPRLQEISMCFNRGKAFRWLETCKRKNPLPLVAGTDTILGQEAMTLVNMGRMPKELSRPCFNHWQVALCCTLLLRICAPQAIVHRLGSTLAKGMSRPPSANLSDVSPRNSLSPFVRWLASRRVRLKRNRTTLVGEQGSFSVQCLRRH